MIGGSQKEGPGFSRQVRQNLDLLIAGVKLSYLIGQRCYGQLGQPETDPSKHDHAVKLNMVRNKVKLLYWCRQMLWSDSWQQNLSSVPLMPTLHLTCVMYEETKAQSAGSVLTS